MVCLYTGFSLVLLTACGEAPGSAARLKKGRGTMGGVLGTLAGRSQPCAVCPGPSSLPSGPSWGFSGVTGRPAGAPLPPLSATVGWLLECLYTGCCAFALTHLWRTGEHFSAAVIVNWLLSLLNYFGWPSGLFLAVSCGNVRLQSSSARLFHCAD